MGVNDADNWGDPTEVENPALISVEDLYVLIGQKEAALLGRDRIIASLRNTITNLTASMKKKEVPDDVAVLRKQAIDAQRTADSLSAKNIKLGDRITDLLHEIDVLKAKQNKPAPKRTKAKKK